MHTHILDAYIHTPMHACMHVCMYVCMYVCVCLFMYIVHLTMYFHCALPEVTDVMIFYTMLYDWVFVILHCCMLQVFDVVLDE